MSLLNGIKAVFFDLDGTLLDMSEDDFTKQYTELIYQYFINILDKDTFFKGFWRGIEDMMKHDDPDRNTLESFADTFSSVTKLHRNHTIDIFLDFYTNSFDELKSIGKSNLARDVIDLCKQKGLKLILATNPVFPEIATQKRCDWIDLSFDDFIYVTHAENFTVVKPYPRYFNELLSKAGVLADETLMVGNSFLYDAGASQVGIKTWIIDKNQDHLQYKDKFSINYEGSMKELFDELSKL
ncbi:MAG: HAD family hydrolase [Candidatus Heimdallarchaeota archaeon]|nr:HAD family hydrolase [Candidatus Heimdallarchaeota archaeon]